MQLTCNEEACSAAQQTEALVTGMHAAGAPARGTIGRQPKQGGHTTAQTAAAWLLLLRAYRRVYQFHSCMFKQHITGARSLACMHPALPSHQLADSGPSCPGHISLGWCMYDYDSHTHAVQHWSRQLRCMCSVEQGTQQRITQGTFWQGSSQAVSRDCMLTAKVQNEQCAQDARVSGQHINSNMQLLVWLQQEAPRSQVCQLNLWQGAQLQGTHN